MRATAGMNECEVSFFPLQIVIRSASRRWSALVWAVSSYCPFNIDCWPVAAWSSSWPEGSLRSAARNVDKRLNHSMVDPGSFSRNASAAPRNAERTLEGGGGRYSFRLGSPRLDNHGQWSSHGTCHCLFTSAWLREGWDFSVEAAKM
jgi:hypothetical protein